MIGKTSARSGGDNPDRYETTAGDFQTETEVGQFPLRTGSDEAFRLMHSFLRDSGYSEAWLLVRFQLRSLDPLLQPRGQRAEDFLRRYHGPGVTPLLARLLMGGLAVSAEELNRDVPARVQDAMRDLGVLSESRGVPSRFLCPALIYPAYDFFIAADRGACLDGTPGYRGLDYVMSGAEDICRAYLECVPDTPCGTFLEIGTGAGLGALRASRTAGHVWATDITSRAVRYADFNRRLNLVSNMTVLQGDLFEPVKALVFDRIACNPPFEPPLKKGYVFSVGGDDGEEITRRVLHSAPVHLNPGGRLYMQVMGSNREGDDFDVRIRRYLGNASEECDVALFVRHRMQPSEYAIHQILDENDDAWKIDEWASFYKELRASEILHAQLVVQRAAERRTVFHTVRSFGSRTGLPQIEWLLDWETRSTTPAHSESLRGSRPTVAPGCRLDVQYAVRDGQLKPDSYILRTEAPFEVELTVDPWIAGMASASDGTRTAAELLDSARSNGALFLERRTRPNSRGSCTHSWGTTSCGWKGSILPPRPPGVRARSARHESCQFSGRIPLLRLRAPERTPDSKQGESQ